MRTSCSVRDVPLDRSLSLHPESLVRLPSLYTFIALALVEYSAQHLRTTRACVVVCNHASYADALVLLAALPAGMPFAFLVKRELAGSWAARTVLARTNMLLVERVDVQRSVQDARAIVQQLQAGDCLLVFAEGTLRRAAGLMPSHLGGFAGV